MFGGGAGGGVEEGAGGAPPADSTTQTATSSGTFDTGEVNFIRSSGVGGGIDKTTIAIAGVVLLVMVFLLRGK